MYTFEFSRRIGTEASVPGVWAYSSDAVELVCIVLLHVFNYHNAQIL